MNRADLRTFIRRQSLITTTEISDASLNTDLEQGILDVATQYAWPWMLKIGTITTAAGTPAYALPADLMYIRNLIHDAEGQASLEPTTLEVVKLVYGDNVGSSDLPHLWYQSEPAKITFVPTPSAVKTVNLHYYATPDLATTFNQDTHTPPWHSAFHIILADYALNKIWEREEDYGRASDHLGRYLQGVDRMANYYTQRFPAQPLVVGGGLSRTRLRRPFDGWPEV